MTHTMPLSSTVQQQSLHCIAVHKRRWPVYRRNQLTGTAAAVVRFIPDRRASGHSSSTGKGGGGGGAPTSYRLANQCKWLGIANRFSKAPYDEHYGISARSFSTYLNQPSLVQGGGGTKRLSISLSYVARKPLSLELKKCMANISFLYKCQVDAC